MNDSAETGCRSCDHLQKQIDALEMNCINEFKALARYRQQASLAPWITALEGLDERIRKVEESLSHQHNH